MRLRIVSILALLALSLVAPSVVGLHRVGDADSGVFTHVSKTFYTPIATAVWWDFSVIRGVPTGIQEYDGVFELNNNNAATVVTAETFPIATPDTPKVCLPVSTPEVVVPAAVVHQMNCVKQNGYTVQIHYFPWSSDPNDPDHVESITAATPTAELAWRVDAVPLSYKTAIIPPGHWQVWVHPAVAPPVGYNIKFAVDSTSSFYYDFLGHRGCPFYADIGFGISDQSLLGCPNDYEA